MAGTFLFAGLGNPGASYAQHRHNVGFMAVDRIAQAHGFGPWRSRFHGHVCEGQLQDHKILLLKPTTYMNDSGQAVGEAARFLKVPREQVVVLHDDLDLAPGKIKVKLGGGDAGHNGLRSITAVLGAGYKRVRIGIGHPGSPERVHGYVLHDFAKTDQEWLDPLLDAIANAAPLLVEGDDTGFLNRIALATKPQRPKTTPKPPAPETQNGI